jgi:hypothetical protein
MSVAPPVSDSLPSILRRAPSRVWPARFSTRIFFILLLTALADFLFFRHPAGWTLGLFSLLTLAGILSTHPFLLKRRAGQLIAAANIIVAGALIHSPSGLAITLALVGALALASLACIGPLPHVFAWAGRLFVMTVTSGAALIALVGRHNRVTRRIKKTFHLFPALRLAVMPLLFALIFLALFAFANPVIENWMSRVDWTAVLSLFNITRWAFWLLSGTALCLLIKPRLPKMFQHSMIPAGTADREPAASRLFTVQSIIVSLLMFNLMFSVQNILDINFLYADAGFASAASPAAYVQRGSWALIATALMAGAFVLIALRRGSPLAENQLIRILLGVWIAQNVLLVGSSILRTLNYIEIYDLTYLRICGLIWMGLVAVGLILICVRVLTNRGNSWLVNGNALAAIAVLVICCWVNFAGIIANYNVRHAREMDGTGASLDVTYLERLGPGVLPASNWFLQQADTKPQNLLLLRKSLDVSHTHFMLEEKLIEQQSNWRSWTLEGARLQKSLSDISKLSESLYEKSKAAGMFQAGSPLTEDEQDALLLDATR